MTRIQDRISSFRDNISKAIKESAEIAYYKKTKVNLDIGDYKIEEEPDNIEKYTGDLFKKQAKIFGETFEIEFTKRIDSFIFETFIIEGNCLDFSSFRFNDINYKKLDLKFDKDLFEVDNQNRLHIKDGAVSFRKIAGNTIGADTVVDGAITGPKINPEVPGRGLSFGDSGENININIDNDTIKLKNNDLYVADNGIEEIKIKDAAITETKFSQSAINFFDEKIKEYLDDNFLDILKEYVKESSLK